MSDRHHVLLVPGFFSFGESLGHLQYFAGVTELLGAALDDLGLDADVSVVETLPTASISNRAAAILEKMASIPDWEEGPIHLVGHSTGGLDARLAMSPAASLPTTVEFDAFDRVHSLTTISTPHHGTTLASFFASLAGKPLLRAAARGTIRGLSHGKLPFQGLVKLGGMMTRFDDRFGLNNTVMDELYDALLSDFSEDRREALIRFLDDVSTNQDLVFQLTPSSMRLFNAAAAMNEGTRYGCVLTRAHHPTLKTIASHKHNVYAQLLHALYAATWSLASFSDETYLPPLSDAQREALERIWGEVPDRRENDGIVPTRSQIFGEVIHAADADHLDVVGHYGAESPDRVRSDWLPTEPTFHEPDFRTLWTRVGEFIARDAAARAA